MKKNIPNLIDAEKEMLKVLEEKVPKDIRVKVLRRVEKHKKFSK